MNLPDAETLFKGLIEQIKPIITADTAIVGIHSGGAWLAERLLTILGGDIENGILDVSFYRDDYNQRGLHNETKPSQIPFEVKDKHILLIDDVFYKTNEPKEKYDINELILVSEPLSFWVKK